MAGSVRLPSTDWSVSKTRRMTGVLAFVGNQIQYRKKRVKNMEMASGSRVVC
jgi:hypothetical protein